MGKRNPGLNYNLNRTGGYYLGYNSESNKERIKTDYSMNRQSRPSRYFNSSLLSKQPAEPWIPCNQQLQTEPQKQPEPEPTPTSSQQPSLDLPTVNENISATTKAESRIDDLKKKWKKTGKIPTVEKRKKLNQRLSKILTPKNALILLNELKPDCVYKVQELSGINPTAFFAHVELNGTILGTGQGMSKSLAKTVAAENAIKMIVTKAMVNNIKKNEGNSEGDISMDVCNDDEDTPESLNWAALASFAMYKMFCEWQSQGADVPLLRPAVKQKSQPKVPTLQGATASKSSPEKKELPPNASELHPAIVLNLMRPGIMAVEIDRECGPGPHSKVTMGYEIDGKMYTGVGGNKKEAKREAAREVLSSLYGLTYNS